MPEAFKRISMVGRESDPRVRATMQGLAPHLLGRGVRVMVAEALEVEFGDADVARLDEADLAQESDLMIAVGGDGTMLYASRLVAEHDVPVLGINRGRLGFLADVTPDAMLRSVDEIVAGNYTSERRLMLTATVESAGEVVTADLALNDVVLHKLEPGRMLEFETWIDGVFVNSHASDGMIVATPTGSTAYALSCSGPIVQPELDAVVLVPISPHTLSDRPIAIPAGQVVEVRPLERRSPRGAVICDGRIIAKLDVGDRLLVRKAQSRLHLIHPPGYDYYRILRSKLHWGRGNSDRLVPRKDGG